MEITSVSTNATTLYVGEQLIVTFQVIDRILDNRGNPILAPKVIFSVRCRFDISRNRIQSFESFFAHIIFDFLPKDTEGNCR